MMYYTDEFAENIAIMDKYELKLYCKKLNLKHYSKLNTRQLKEFIAYYRKKKMYQILIKNNNSIFYPEIIQIIMSFADFIDETLQNRIDAIKMAKKRIQYPLLCHLNEYNKENLLNWFNINNYPIEIFKHLRTNQLLSLYLYEWQRIRILSFNPFEIFKSHGYILKWLKYLRYDKYNQQKYLHWTKKPYLQIKFKQIIHELQEFYPEIILS